MRILRIIKVTFFFTNFICCKNQWLKVKSLLTLSSSSMINIISKLSRFQDYSNTLH